MDVLYLSPADWPGPIGRFQHIAERFARTNRVMYADGLGVRPVGHRDWRRSSSKVLRWLRPRASRPDVTSGLYRITPFAIPGQTSVCQRINRSLLSGYISRHLEKNEFHNPLLWIAYPHPDLVAIIDRFSPRAVVYDCVDEWSGFKRAYENLAAAEETLARRADLIFATAAPLHEKLSSWNRRCFLVANGVDIEAFAAKNTSLPADVARIHGPRVGFVGGIDERVDLELVRAIARAREDWQLIFTGRYLATAARPESDNIHWLGYRPYDQVASYMASFDVCIIPFLEDELTRALDPLKLYEYLATGKPVVSTPLPRVAEFSSVVRMARGSDDFIAAIDDALREGDRREERIAAVREHSWEARVNEIEGLIRQHLAIELS